MLKMLILVSDLFEMTTVFRAFTCNCVDELWMFMHPQHDEVLYDHKNGVQMATLLLI